MKLNKFLVAAAAVAVLPLSVANAEEPTSPNGPAPAPTVEKPEFTGGVNGAEAAVEPALPALDPATGKPFVGEGKNGTGAINDVKPYGASVVKPLVNEKPEYKPSNGTFKVDKGTEAPKADQTKKVLPKTSAVK